MSVTPEAVNFVRRGARTGGIVGGLAGVAGGGALGFLPKKHQDQSGKTVDRTTGQRVLGGALSAGLLGWAGHDMGRLGGAMYNANRWIKGYRPPIPRPDWLKGAKTKAEARRAYHAQARKVHPDLHGGDDGKFKDLSNEWEKHEPTYKTAMLNALADELEKIAQNKQAMLGALLGGAAGYKLSPNSLKGKAIGTLIGAGVGAGVGAAAKGAKRTFVDELHHREQRDLYGYQPAVG